MSNILRRLFLQKKDDGGVDWVNNEELRAYVRVSMDTVFALDEKVGRVALEGFLSFANGMFGKKQMNKARRVDDVNKVKTLINPFIDEWMVHKMPAVLEGKVALAPGHWVPVKTSGLRFGGIIKDEQMRNLVADESVPDVAPFEGMGELPPDPVE